MSDSNQVVITGIGMIGDFGFGKEEFCSFVSGKTLSKKKIDLNYEQYLPLPLLRRADENSYFASIAAKYACLDANISDELLQKKNTGLIIGTTHGALEYSLDYHKEMVMENPQTVSPLLFSNSVLNAMASYISILLKISGYTTTLTGYNTVLQSIKYGSDLIKQGELDICFVGGVDIFNEILDDAYGACSKNSIFQDDKFGGSGIIILESLDCAKKRNAAIYAKVADCQTGIVDADCQILANSMLRLDEIETVISSEYFNEGNRNNFHESLEKIKNNILVFDCTPLFGTTFSAGEIFKVILGVLYLKNLVRLPDFNDHSKNNVMITHASKLNSQGSLVLEKV